MSESQKRATSPLIDPVFVQASGPGVIYLRILPAMVHPVHTELARVLTLYTEQQLQASFIVVEPGRHRIRKV